MVLVTGATGFVGAALLARLLATNSKVRACYQSDYRKNQLIAYWKKGNLNTSLLDNVEWVEANINNLSRLEKAFEGVRIVYHCAAKVDLDDSNNAQLLKTNVEGTANVVNCCIKKEVEKLLYVSSIAALGDPIANALIDENTPWNEEVPKTGYAYSKYKAELEVWRAMQEGVPAVIVNPGVILGFCHRTGPSKSFLNYVQRNTYYYTSGGTGYVHVDAVVTALVQLASSEVKNERFILVSENLTYQDFLNQLRQENQLKSNAKFISNSFLKIIWMLDAWAAFLKFKKKVFSKGLVLSLTSRAVYDGTKICTFLPDFKYPSLQSGMTASETK